MEISGEKVYVLIPYIENNVSSLHIDVFSSYRVAEEHIKSNYSEGKWEKVMGKFQNPNYKISFRIVEREVC
jgi:hypothetical protein